MAFGIRWGCFIVNLLATGLVGAAGAAAPELLRLYKWRSNVDTRQFTRAYFVISILYICLGAVVAIILTSDSNLLNSFYTGLALPLVIDSAGTNLSAAKIDESSMVGGQQSQGDSDLIEETRLRPRAFSASLRGFMATL